MMRTLSVLILAVLACSSSAGASPGPRRAFLRSLLVPGWGQRYGGRTEAAFWFAGSELALWGGYFGARRLADVRQNRYRAYAAVHAGAQTAGKSGAFFDDVGFYTSVQEHNEYAAYSEGPEPGLYPTTPEFFWEWDTEAARQRYRHLHNASADADRQALYLAGLVVVNHVVAAVHAARTVRGTGDSGTAATPGSPAVQVAYDPRQRQARIAWVRRF